MKKVLVCGMNPAWQKTMEFSRLVPYEVNRAETLRTIASGKGINFARALLNWGTTSAAVLHPLGGSTGKMITESLAGEGIPSIAVTTECSTRICSTLMCKATGTATEIIEPSGTVLPEEYEKLMTVASLEIAGSDALAICGTYPPGIPEHCYADLVSKAAGAGKPVLLDACKNIGNALSCGTTLLKINKSELSGMTGCDSVEKGIRLCLEKYPLEYVAITAGKECAYIGSRKRIIRITVPAISNAINPIGAGDTCSGVFFAEYLSGTEPEEAFARGLCAATASCMTDTPAKFEKETAIQLREKVELYPL